MANSTNARNKKALLIAVQSVDQKGFLPLHHAHEDVQSLKCLLINNFGYSEENMMKDDTELPNHLWPSRKNIARLSKTTSGKNLKVVVPAKNIKHSIAEILTVPSI
ncbi:hypothetical protein DFH29DRAFT_147193 [Suillus ampliporus]|nr:hypothetical protein DFH29DRAFT_147193 [Suillus ampliporus]